MKKQTYKPFKFDEKTMLLFCKEHEMFKYNWKFKDLGTGVWAQDLDSNGNPIPTGRLGIHWNNILSNTLSCLVYVLMFLPLVMLFLFPI